MIIMRFSLLVLTALIAISPAQNAIGFQDTAPAFSVSVNLVKIPISVFDDSGNMVADLRVSDFRVWEDQAAQEIRSFGMDTTPVSAVVLLDISTSSKDELKKIKDAAEEFAESLSPGDRISILTFDDEANQALDWTNDMRKVRRALKRIKTGFRSSLHDAMFLAAQDQLKGIEGRKAIILLTDCLNNESRVSFQEASLAVVQSQASLYVVSKTAMVRQQAKQERRVVMLEDIYKRLFGGNEDYIDEFFRKREAAMTDLAEKTGGRCFFPADYNNIKHVYAEVARELKSKYYLTYVSNQNLLPDSYHRISVEYLPPSSKISYRKGYYYLPRPVSRGRLRQLSEDEPPDPSDVK